MHIVLRDFLLYLHILLGITWLGGILFVGWGVYPATKKVSLSIRKSFLIALMQHSHRILTFAGTMVIMTGILLGTVFGPLHSLPIIFHSRYGLLFISAFLLAIFGLLWGTLVSYRSTLKMLNDKTIWNQADKGNHVPLNKKMRQVTMISGIEVGCLLIIVWIMVII